MRFFKKSKKSGLLLLGIVSIISLQAQQQGSTLGKINIASPNAAALGKYIDIPVSYHTGIPNISIPVYTIAHGPIKLPVSLSYHASGLKVEENASWVGAGWSLNAGGAITRTVKDKPDEKQTSSLVQTHGHFSDYGFASNYAQNGMQAAESFDAEPDLFFYNFGGYSGKFYFNDDRTPVMVPENDIKVECNYTPGQWNNSPGAWSGFGRCIESFTLTTPDGTKYFFGISQSQPMSPYCDPIEVASSLTNLNGMSYSQVISSWFLNKVVSADGNYQVDLQYVRDKYASFTYSNAMRTFPVNNGPYGTTYAYNKVKNFTAGVRLSKIKTTNEEIEFTAGAARQDLARWQTGLDENLNDAINETSPSLGGIVISDNLGNCQKKFQFTYSYFDDNTGPVHANFSDINSDKKRLKLLSMQEQSCNGTVSVPPYTFEYFSETVPRKLSFGKDHWGYINGVTNNTQLYPELRDGNNSVVNTNIGIDIANRESAWPAMRGGTLNKINYPTGGFTSLDYEPNKFYVVENGSNVEKMVGGLRVKTIVNYDPSTAKSITTNYSYNGTNNLSSGVLYSKPAYIQVFRNDWIKKKNDWGNANGNGCWDNYDANYVTSRSYLVSDNPIRPMETSQGYHIGYSDVKVSQQGNGYSLFRFSVTPPWGINRDGLAITKMSNPGTCDINIPSYPAPPLANDFYRGEPTFEGIYNESGAVLKEKTFYSLYQENPVTTPGYISFIYNPTQSNPAETFYELKTAKKIESDVTEITYQAGGGSSTSIAKTFFESNYHHEPTRIETTDSKGQVVTKKMKYSFDFRVPSFENVSDCYTGAASFLSYVNSLFYSGGYAASFASCGGFVQTCYGTLQTNFYSAFCNARKSYVDCRKTNFTNTNPLNTYQSNHNAAKAASNPELRTILWMQDIGMNAPVEVTTWKGNNLTGASLTAFNNVRDDKFGIYPEKTQKIELAGPSATFTSVAVAANNTSLTKDSRYKDDILVDYNAGNMITATMNDGVPESYEWGYNNSRVIAKISNAVNKSKETLVNGAAVIPVTFQLGSNIPAYSNQFSIEQVQSGNISLAITAPPPGAQVQINYSISGPVTQTGVICNAGSGGASCGSNTSSVTFSAMPAGQYTVTINASTSFGSYTFNNTVTCGYYGKIIQLSGLKEFFYEGFETNASAVNGNGHTGKYYYNGNYTTAFAVPNARNYVISWWKLVSGVWTYNQQAYSGPVTLTGPVDDIRICPSDAFMTTYTHDPVKGITSEMDARGRVTTYEYDPLNRLILVRDNDGNVLKKICYNFSGQAENCTTPCTNTAANWQNTANTRCQLGPDSHYTGVLEQEQMDINNCSPSYNTTRWVTAGTNTTTCPLPPYVTLTSTNTNGSPGWVASYYDTLTHYTYNLNVPTSTTLQYLGGIPAGIYNLTISRPVLGGVVSLFKSGCTRFTVSGTSVTFYNINVTASSCNSITIMPDTSN